MLVMQSAGTFLMHELRTHAEMYKALKALPGALFGPTVYFLLVFLVAAPVHALVYWHNFSLCPWTLQAARMSWWASATMSSGPSPSGEAPSTHMSGVHSSPCACNTIAGIVMTQEDGS